VNARRRFDIRTEERAGFEAHFTVRQLWAKVTAYNQSVGEILYVILPIGDLARFADFLSGVPRRL